MSRIPMICVLVAEDDAINREVLSGILSRVDAAIVVAENGLEAVEAFRRQTFDVVLMDLQMPMMDGFAALREIREIEKSRGAPPTPLVVISAHSSPTDVRDSLAAGANYHIGKPVDLGRLLLVITEAISSAAEDDIARMREREARDRPR